MPEQFSINDLIQSLEGINGQILIPDEEVHWLWDSINNQYYNIDEHDRTIVIECLETASVKTEIRTLDENGNRRFYENIFIPIIRDHWQTRLILKLSFDVTEKILTEKIISEERDKLANITMNSPDAVIMLDSTRHVISWNKGAEGIFGFTSDEMINEPVDKLFHDHSFSDLLASEISKEQPFIQHLTVRGTTKHGRDLFCEAALMVLQNKTELETVLILRDKTHQKLLEDESRRTLENLSKINEISALIHASLNLDEILNMILVAATAGQGLRFNRAFLFLINEPKTILLGTKAIGPSNPHEAGLLWTELEQKHQSLQEILKSNKSVHDGRDFKVNEMITSIRIPVDRTTTDGYLAFYDALHAAQCILITKDSPYLTAKIRDIFLTDQLAIVPLISKDGPLGVLVVDNSITGRLISDQDLETLKIFAHQIVAALENAVLYDKLQRKVEELEEAHQSLKDSQEKLIRSEKLAAIGELSAKMAHEIRNPLVAIGGFARAMLNRKHVQANEEYLKIIVDETMRLEHILNDTLTYVRSVEPVKQRQTILPIVENALVLLSHRFANNNIMVKTEFHPQLPETEFDSGQIQQAILNILINADEAMPSGGELFVKLNFDSEFVCLIIRDTGEGIDEEHVKKIFDPFFTTKHKGSGLGLVVVHDIFEKHGVLYDVQSEKNKGTTFTIRFRIPS
jgi:PAS domain S-box-containing protein